MGLIYKDADLMKAVENFDLDGVKILVQCGADITYMNRPDWSVLDQAKLDGSTEIVEYLISKGAKCA